MKSFLFFFVSSILFLGCNPEDFEINYSGPPTNFSYDDQFNAIQGDVLGGNIFDNDELKLPPYQLESYNLKSARGYPVSISQSGRINYSPPPEYFGRDTFAYTLLTLYENGEKRTESLAFVYLSIIEKKRSGHVTDPRDGQLYPTILLDDGKVWTAKNLNIDLEGSSVSSDGLQYGRLYTWSTAIDACPEG